MDLFPTLLEEYDLTGAPGVDEFRDHILKSIDDNMHRGHSLAVNGVSSHGGSTHWAPLHHKKYSRHFKSV